MKPDVITLLELLCAIMSVETGGEPNPDEAIGDNGHAVGCMQIHMCVIEDVNRIYKTKYVSDDRYDRSMSLSIASRYLTYWGEHYTKTTGQKATTEVLARIWNGGPYGYKMQATLKYYKKVLDAIDAQSL